MKSYIIGIDLGGTNIKSALLKTDCTIVCERTDPTEAAKGPAHVLHTIKKIVNEMMEQEGISQQAIKCMGLGIPGLLDKEKGISIFSPNFPMWRNVHVVEEMNRNFYFPVYIDNDVRVNMYGEWLYGAGVGYNNLFLATIGTGLGGAIVHQGEMIYGTTSSAGEIGHMNMYREGRPCRCGSSGCLGRYVSAIGMVRTFMDKLEQGRTSEVQQWINGDNNQITAEMLSRAYDMQDPLAIEVLHETGDLLGYGLTNVINLLNPQIIIIGGGVSAAGDRLLDPARQTIANHALSLSKQVCTIVQGKLGHRAGMIGAAAYANRRS